MKKSNNNMPIVFYVGLLLVCLTFFSVHMSSGLYARYVTTVSGSDTARVAKFEIEENLTLTNSKGETSKQFVVGDTLRPGQSTKYTYTVKNSSEVTVKFIISGESRFKELPLLLTTQELVLKPGETKDITFEVAWDTSNDAYLNESYGDKIDIISITVRIEQVD